MRISAGSTRFLYSKAIASKMKGAWTLCDDIATEFALPTVCPYQR